MGNKYVLMILVLLLFIMLLIYALSIGTIEIEYLYIIEIIYEKIFGNPGSSVYNDIIYYLRLPRMIMAILVGAGLAICGCVLQAVIKNPLADPYILGISSGAGLGGVIAIIFGINSVWGYNAVGLFSCFGAIGITATILCFDYMAGRKNTNIILLFGIAVNTICSAAISLLVILFADIEGIQNISFWLMGSLLESKWNNIFVLSIICASISIYFLFQYRILNVMLFGEETSLTLGYSLSEKRKLYILLCSFIVGFIVYNVGLIGFVGLVVPHIARLIVGNNHLQLLPMSMIIGAIFMVLSDMFSRGIINGTEIPIGIVVSVLGSPIFIYFLFRKKYYE